MYNVTSLYTWCDKERTRVTNENKERIRGWLGWGEDETAVNKGTINKTERILIVSSCWVSRSEGVEETGATRGDRP